MGSTVLQGEPPTPYSSNFTSININPLIRIWNGKSPFNLYRLVKLTFPALRMPPAESSKAWKKHLEQVRLRDRIKRLEADPPKTQRLATTISKKFAKESLKSQDDDRRDDLTPRAEALIRDLKAECEDLRKTNKEIEHTLKALNSLKRKHVEPP